MKLRIGGNSIRLRLLRSEVATLRAGEALRETLNFGGGTVLTYALVPSGSTAVVAHFVDAAIVVDVPAQQLQPWADGDEVGIYEQIALEAGETLSIAIEKDFACLDRSDADNQDTFAHPNAGAVC